MKQSWLVIAVAVLMVSACGKKNEENTAVTKAPPPAETAEQTTQPSEAKIAETTASTMEESHPSTAMEMKKSGKISDNPQSQSASAAGGSVLSREEGLALAGKSGCMACHQIETKLVGPALRDVSKRYKGDAGAKARLIEKVKKGGKGNWTAVTGGVPMPANSPRVSDENIEKLVTFVLAL